jgi:hypothetical protein
MYLIQLLLPNQPPDGEPFPPSSFSQTRAELIEHFGGLTAYTRSPASGSWTAPDGNIERDDVIMVEVLAGIFDRAWWLKYTKTLEERFRQDKIHVRAILIETM